MKTVHVMFHNDDCGELLDAAGDCPKCGFPVDMQSTAFTERPVEEITRMLDEGKTFLGLYRRQFYQGYPVEDFIPPAEHS